MAQTITFECGIELARSEVGIQLPPRYIRAFLETTIASNYTKRHGVASNSSSVAEANDQHVTCAIPCTLHGDEDVSRSRIIVWVFGTYAVKVDGRWPIDHILGIAVVPLFPLKLGERIAIISHENTLQGHLIITTTTTTNVSKLPFMKHIKQSNSINNNNTADVKAEAVRRSYIERCERFIQSVHKDVDLSMIPKHMQLSEESRVRIGCESPIASFMQVMHQGRAMPVSAFLAKLPALEGDALPLMSYWLKLAKSNMGITSTLRKQEETSVVMEVIGEMFTMPFKSQLYASDYNIVKGSPEDSWNPPGVLTNWSRLAIDCEDGMLGMFQLVAACRGIKDSDALDDDMRIVLQTLEGYSMCGVIGRILSGDTYIWHAYPCLFDTRWIARQCSDDDDNDNDTDENKVTADAVTSASANLTALLPPIVMETTNYLPNVYTTVHDLDNTTQAEVDESMHYATGNKVFEDDASWRYVVHLKAPAHTVIHQHVYGAVCGVFTLDTPNRESSAEWQPMTQLLLHYDDKKRLGVDPADLFRNKQQLGTIQSWTIPPDAHEIAAMNALELCFPRMQVPSMPTVKKCIVPEPVNSSTHWRYWVKNVDTKNTDHLIRSVAKKNSIRSYQVDTSKDASCTVYDCILPTD
jgi:hypothetical protein